MLCKTCGTDKNVRGIFCLNCMAKMPDEKDCHNHNRSDWNEKTDGYLPYRHKKDITAQNNVQKPIPTTSENIIAKILSLRKKDYTIRQIARELKLPQTKVFRVLKNGWNMVNKKRNKVVEQGWNMVEQTPVFTDDNPNKLIGTEMNNTISSLYSSHHYGYEILAKGKINDIKEGELHYAGNKLNPYPYRIIRIKEGTEEAITIEVRPSKGNLRLNISVKKEYIERFKSDKPAELTDIARNKVLAELQALAERNRMTYNVSSFGELYEPHLVVEDAGINSFVSEEGISREEKDKLAQDGIKLGDRSHPNEIEFTKDAEGRGERLKWVIDEFPKHIAEYNENIRTHLAAVTELKETNKDIRGAIIELKEQNKAFNDRFINLIEELQKRR